MQRCSSCGTKAHDDSAKFCSKCGTGLTSTKELKYVSVNANTGEYGVTFAPQVVIASCADSVWEKVRDSAFGEDGEFQGEAKVNFIRSTVTPKTHPYECVICAITPNATVSVTDEGKCEMCDQVNWRLRKVGQSSSLDFSKTDKARVLRILEGNISDMSWPGAILIRALFAGCGDTVPESVLRAAIQLLAVQIAQNVHFTFAESSNRISAEITELKDGKATVTIAYGGAQTRSIEIEW